MLLYCLIDVIWLIISLTKMLSTQSLKKWDLKSLIISDIEFFSCVMDYSLMSEEKANQEQG